MRIAFGVATDFIKIGLIVLMALGTLRESTNESVLPKFGMLIPESTAACSLGKTILIQFKSEDITCECFGALKMMCESQSLIPKTGDLIDVEIWAKYVSFVLCSLLSLRWG